MRGRPPSHHLHQPPINQSHRSHTVDSRRHRGFFRQEGPPGHRGLPRAHLLGGGTFGAPGGGQRVHLRHHDPTDRGESASGLDPKGDGWVCRFGRRNIDIDQSPVYIPDVIPDVFGVIQSIPIKDTPRYSPCAIGSRSVGSGECATLSIWASQEVWEVGPAN